MQSPPNGAHCRATTADLTAGLIGLSSSARIYTWGFDIAPPQPGNYRHRMRLATEPWDIPSFHAVVLEVH
jgi:hypothetical protein